MLIKNNNSLSFTKESQNLRTILFFMYLKVNTIFLNIDNKRTFVKLSLSTFKSVSKFLIKNYSIITNTPIKNVNYDKDALQLKWNKI